ncbi:pleckstrin homology domain-containing family A member 3-like [Conger conger]|uniref:pleckstrin homology domain-containing family A member 3-like n=1 Tax=Conger conger TaxID=82655 RepID=UPI002A5AC81A|nr:pleckstrin homology domain-containing family A member 3-like [Conger conger]
MEGILLKWTNYFLGWQPRYFVLEGLFLTYYLSKDDVGKTVKGSGKMGLCEIQVHPTDSRRFELHFSGEQSLHLMVQNFGERQRWLVALGSAKACLIDQRPGAETERTRAAGGLRGKMSELQLCCHLLVEQVHVLQGCAQPMEDQAQTLLATSSALRKTCSMFLGTLEECMKIGSSVPQPCALAPPVSPSVVGRSRLQD